MAAVIFIFVSGKEKKKASAFCGNKIAIQKQRGIEVMKLGFLGQVHTDTARCVSKSYKHSAMALMS